MEARWLGVKELSKYTSMPEDTIYTYVSRRRIPPECVRRIGRKLLFDLTAVDRWISGSAPPAAQATAQEHTRSAH